MKGIIWILNIDPLSLKVEYQNTKPMKQQTKWLQIEVDVASNMWESKY